jgi:hypothetical protein
MRILLGKTDKNNGKYENLVIDKNKIFLEKNDNKNLVCLFPTRTGFTTGIAIPTVYNNTENMIVFDFDNEIFNATKEHKKEQGYTIYCLELKNVHDNNRGFYMEDIDKILKAEKYIIYIKTTLSNIKIFKESIILSIFDRVQTDGRKCITLFDDCYRFLKSNTGLYHYITKNTNNQFILKFQSNEQVNLGICSFDILSIDIGKSEDKKSVISQYRYIKNGITEKVDRDNDYMLLKEW